MQSDMTETQSQRCTGIVGDTKSCKCRSADSAMTAVGAYTVDDSALGESCACKQGLHTRGFRHAYFRQIESSVPYPDELGGAL